MTEREQATEIARWNAERDDLLRSLDVKKFQAFWHKHNLPMPAEGEWASPDVPLITMHKCRLQVNSMTEAEKDVSRQWLLSHHYSLEIVP